jgi:hypothetical protein
MNKFFKLKQPPVSQKHTKARPDGSRQNDKEHAGSNNKEKVTMREQNPQHPMQREQQGMHMQREHNHPQSAGFVPPHRDFSKEEHRQPSQEDLVTFSTMDFFDRFVRSANEKGLLKTPLPTPLSRQHIMMTSVQLLQAARIDKRDVRIEDDNYGGTIQLSQLGLAQIHGFLIHRQQQKAAIMIQKWWRGYRVRKQLGAEFQARISAANNEVDVEGENEHLFYEQYIMEISENYNEILLAKRTSVYRFNSDTGRSVCS